MRVCVGLRMFMYTITGEHTKDEGSKRHIILYRKYEIIGRQRMGRKGNGKREIKGKETKKRKKGKIKKLV